MRSSLHSKTHWTRRLIYTAIVIVVAVGLGWWGNQRESKRFDVIRTRVQMLCTSLADGEDVTHFYPMATPAVAPQVMQRIQDLVMSIPDGDDEAIDIVVAPEGLAPFDRGSATHQAMIFVHDQPMLGLMFEAGKKTEDVIITGYWDPIVQ